MDQAQSYLGLVGTRGDISHEVHSYEVDVISGSLSRLAVSNAGENPAYLAVHPNRERLYAVNQVEDGAITSLSIDRSSGELSTLNQQKTNDLRPCYVSVDATGSVALVAHHTGGSVSVLPIADDGRLGEVSDFVVRDGEGPNTERQSKSRPHAILTGPDNRYVYVPDLGADRIWIYELDIENGELLATDTPDVKLQSGAGPRHFEFHPNERYAYLINELDATLTAFERDPDTGGLTEIDAGSTLPPSFDGHNQTADVHVHPAGKWVYGSNRGHNSIAAFEIDAESGGLEPIDITSTRGEWPRGFAIDPTGAYLFAANQKSGDIVTFDIDGDTGELSAIGDRVSIPSPTCMKLIPFE